jgi:hypothetical protein
MGLVNWAQIKHGPVCAARFTLLLYICTSFSFSFSFSFSRKENDTAQPVYVIVLSVLTSLEFSLF